MFVRRFMLSALMLAALAVSGIAQTKASLDELSWLSGCWEGRQRDAVIEEIWSKPAGLSMLGLSRTVKNGQTVSFEFMQFREENGTLVFLPQPQGGTRVPFRLVKSADEEMTFENLKHDFPQRIIYQRKGQGLLLASIEGMQNEQPQRQEFQMRKVRCN